MFHRFGRLDARSQVKVPVGSPCFTSPFSALPCLALPCPAFFCAAGYWYGPLFPGLTFTLVLVPVPCPLSLSGLGDLLGFGWRFGLA